MEALGGSVSSPPEKKGKRGSVNGRGPRRDSMFGKILEDRNASLYTAHQVSGDDLPPDMEEGQGTSQLLGFLTRCLPGGAQREQEELAAAEEARRRKWAVDLREFFEEFGQVINLQYGETLVSPKAATGPTSGLDNVYFVLRGTLVEVASEGDDYFNEPKYYTTGSIINADCFLQGSLPLTTLVVHDTETGSFNRADLTTSFKKPSSTRQSLEVNELLQRSPTQDLRIPGATVTTARRVSDESQPSSRSTVGATPSQWAPRSRQSSSDLQASPAPAPRSRQTSSELASSPVKLPKSFEVIDGRSGSFHTGK